MLLYVHYHSQLEGSPTSVGPPGKCHSPVIAVENVDVGQPILVDISSDGIHVSRFRSPSRCHTFYLHVQHCSGDMAFISTSDMSIPALSLLHQVCCYQLNCCCFPDLFIYCVLSQANAFYPLQPGLENNHDFFPQKSNKKDLFDEIRFFRLHRFIRFVKYSRQIL